MKPNRPLEEELLFLPMIRVRKAALDRADGLTRFVIIEPDAFGAELGVDDVDLVTLADGLVRALGLASAAVDAVGGNVRRHDSGR